MSKFWSKALQGVTPYTSGEQPKDQKYVKLNTNENPYPPSPKVLDVIKSFDLDTLRLYPDADTLDVKNAVANFYDVTVQNVFVGNSSDEVLALSFLSFFITDKPLVFPDISYSFYPVYCDLYKITPSLSPVNENFDIDFDSFPTENGGVIFPNPNAPTGKAVDLATIEKVVQKHANSVVIVDEAYVDFGAESAIELTKKYNNLLVIHTLSKSRSLAGLRVGYAIGHEDLITGLNMAKNSFNSYPLDRIAIAGATAAINDRDYFEECCSKIIKTREWATTELEALGFKVIPSAANFFFVSPNGKYRAQDLYLDLKEKGVLVRYWNKPKISDWVRITIGTDEEMKILIAKIKELLD